MEVKVKNTLNSEVIILYAKHDLRQGWQNSGNATTLLQDPAVTDDHYEEYAKSGSVEDDNKLVFFQKRLSRSMHEREEKTERNG